MKKRILLIGAGFGIVVLFSAIVLLASEHYTGRAVFCGTQCHTMRKPYETWKKDKHSMGPHSKIKHDVACVDCHFAPGEKPTPRGKFRSLGQLFSYLATKDKEVRKRAVIKDASCLTAECHPKKELIEKKIDFTKKYQTEYKGTLISFEHKTHEDKTIEGQKLHCSSCHIHSSAGRHFEVPRELCFLCHFRKGKDNEGRSKCSVCHKIPKKSLQKQKSAEEKSEEEKSEDRADSKPITHQTLEKAKVACSSCHFELVKGNVEIKNDSCIDCHHNPTPELMEKIKDKKVMHAEHVTKQTARCFNCHEPLQHKQTSYLDAPIQHCSLCHPDPHLSQKIIIAGGKRKGVGETPALMHGVKTGCFGCHTEKGHDMKGRNVTVGSPKACVGCHTKDHEKMLGKWVKEVSAELKGAREVEKEAALAVEQAKGRVSDAKLKAAMALLKEGQDNLRIVDAGGGVHNKKYSILLIDAAINEFEELMNDLMSD